MWVCGSTARGEDKSSSDLDLLVRFAPDASLFDQAGLAQEFEYVLKIHVDVGRRLTVEPSDRLRNLVQDRLGGEKQGLGR